MYTLRKNTTSYKELFSLYDSIFSLLVKMLKIRFWNPRINDLTNFSVQQCMHNYKNRYVNERIRETKK